MEPLSDELHELCKKTLLYCEEFQSSRGLRNFFEIDEHLNPFAGSLTDGSTDLERFNNAYSLILKKSHEDGSLLIETLMAVRSSHENDKRFCGDIDNCILRIKEELNNRKLNDRLVSIPFVIAAMTQNEASEAISGAAFNIRSAGIYDSEDFIKIRKLLGGHNITEEKIKSRYGKRREDWKPYLEVQDSIMDIINNACYKINELICNRLDCQASGDKCKYVKPEFWSSKYFEDPEIREKFGRSGVVLVIDDLSFFHPALNKHLQDIIHNDLAAIIMLSTLRGRDLDRDFYDMIEAAIRERIEKAYRRYDKDLDWKCEIGVDDLRTFVRWLSKVLPEQAVIVGNKKAHPGNKWMLQGMFKGEMPDLTENVIGSQK